MKRLFVICLIAFSSIARAQSTISTSIFLKPFGLPDKLKKTFIPSKSSRFLCFYSAFAGRDGKEIGLLFYARPATAQEQASHQKFKDLHKNFGVTSLVVVEKDGARAQWHLVRSVPLGVARVEDVKLYWLSPQTKTGPIIVVERDIDSNFGPRGYETIAFPDGWQQKTAVRQIFHDWSNPAQYASNRFDSVDERGFLQVTETIYSGGDVNSVDKVNKHIWNGSGWSQ
ncbi:MAG TPA: hypothetical protein VF627_13150 [Abditibacterium sp.]